LSVGWAELAPIDDGPDCIVVGGVSHQTLFPQVAAVVHHGGAGTTTAAALAGAPQVIMPMFSDQFYWGRRVATLGLGAIAEGACDVEELTQALEAALRPETVACARSTARRISMIGAGIAARAVVNSNAV
jgi:vancomycin aglycone glucosyltransferase